ncbi:ABC transporter permease [Paenibacillus eucommiae]|uniref:ABC-2 type transport system permease protein n=1 Tax=Paenibacillus eucommiae TaxID=1355755 RepID=A0ABS4JBE8_9BACL|nr:ABC-2 family transporter protein [Paenibacillus eucommiae]MBP1996571.1 ABC-2 type transport system permease protein [Paenibacillus eucommiae]
MKFLYVFYLSFKSQTIYLAHVYMSIMFALTQVVVLFFFWKAVYTGRTLIDTYTFQDMITYILMAQIIDLLIFFSIERYISSQLADGSIGVRLHKPISFPVYVMFDQMGHTGFRIMTSVLPMFFIVLFFFDVHISLTFIESLVFIFSLIASWILLYCIQFIFGLFVFFTMADGGIRGLRVTLVRLLSGSLVPLSMYPDWLQLVVMNIPLKLIYFVPLSILTGKHTSDFANKYDVIHQILIKLGMPSLMAITVEIIVWLAVFLLSVNYLWNQTKRDVVIQGGKDFENPATFLSISKAALCEVGTVYE